MTCTLTGWSLTKARVRPSANCTRRRIRSSSAAMSLALSSARAGWRAAISNTAVTWPCSTPWRTSVWSPRAPSASAKASSKIDLPAPVSPVSTARCPAKSMSSRSIRTMSRIESRESMAWRIRCDAPSLKTWMAGTRPVQFLAQPDLLEGPADPGTLVLGRLQAAVFHQRIGVLVPFAVGEIVPEHGGRGLCLLDDAERHIGFGQALERLLDMAGGLIAGHHDFETIDGAGVVLLRQVIAADLHFLAGELVARDFQLLLGADGVFTGRIFARDFLKRGERLFGAGLVAGDVGNLVEIRRADQILRIGRVRAAGVERDIALSRGDALLIGTRLIVGIGRHDEGFAGPFGIRMLAVDFLEFLDRLGGVFLLVEEEEAFIVEPFGRLVRRCVVFVEPTRTGAQARGQQKDRQGAHRAAHDAAHAPDRR